MAKAVRFDLVADASRFTKGMRDAQRSSQQFTQHTQRAGSALKAAFGAFSAGAAVLEIRKWVAAARDSNRVTAQVNAVIASTHGATGLSAKGFADLAKSIEKTAAVDDDIIAGGEAILATFTKVKAGGPDKVFERATQAAVDMAAALNHGQVTAEGLQQANLLLGKALQDPVAGLTKLMRAGVSFSAQQKEQIADFVKHGQVAKAQGVILAEVNKEFGGSAAAAVTPAKRLAAQWGDMQEVLGNLLIPAIDRGAQILSSILGVVDRNRTAFGLLFGMLGTGAAIIGTLIVAEKIHRAVSDSIKVVTTTWAAAQKGLNLVLGTTKVQAEAAAAAEGALATSTGSATLASGAASAAMGRNAGATSDFARQGIAAIPILGALAGGFALSIKAGTDNVSVFDELRHALGFHVAALDKQEAATQKAAQTQAQLTADAMAAGVAEGQLTGKTEQQARAMVDNAAKAKELGGQLQTLRGQFHQAADSVRDSILSYQGLIRQSKVTAGEVIKDLRNQVLNFATYSSDVHRLIKAGVNPAAIQELSQKGPQYVHALATGSNTELERYKRFWRDRQAEIKGGFAKSMQEQLQDLAKKIRAMQLEIDRLHGKNIYIAGSLKLNFTKSFTQKDWVDVRLAAGRMAEGGIVQGPGTGRSDSVPRWLSKGEYVVNADATKAYLPYLEWMNAKRMALGGPVGQIDAETRAINRVQAGGTGAIMNRGINKIMESFGALPGVSANVAQVARWTATVLHQAASAAAWARRIMFESGGNWTAVNRTDINWLQGHPSVGGAQVIRGTFQRYAGPYRNVGPFLYGVSVNPYANSYAGANYATARYGSIAAVDPRVRPIGYDRGGVLQPGLNVMWNGTGRTEALVPAASGPVMAEVDEVKLGRAVRRALEGMTLVVDDRGTGRLVARQAGIYARGG